MSWINDLCKSIKSKCWCWCQCICCPNGDVHADNDDENKTTPDSSIMRTKIKEYFIETSKIQASLHQNDQTQKEIRESQSARPSSR